MNIFKRLYTNWVIRREIKARGAMLCNAVNAYNLAQVKGADWNLKKGERFIKDTPYYSPDTIKDAMSGFDEKEVKEQ